MEIVYFIIAAAVFAMIIYVLKSRSKGGSGSDRPSPPTSEK